MLATMAGNLDAENPPRDKQTGRQILPTSRQTMMER
jgi:hypothetical protein